MDNIWAARRVAQRYLGDRAATSLTGRADIEYTEVPAVISVHVQTAILGNQEDPGKDVPGLALSGWGADELQDLVIQTMKEQSLRSIGPWPHVITTRPGGYDLEVRPNGRKLVRGVFQQDPESIRRMRNFVTRLGAQLRGLGLRVIIDAPPGLRLGSAALTGLVAIEYTRIPLRITVQIKRYSQPGQGTSGRWGTDDLLTLILSAMGQVGLRPGSYWPTRSGKPGFNINILGLETDPEIFKKVQDFAARVVAPLQDLGFKVVRKGNFPDARTAAPVRPAPARTSSGVSSKSKRRWTS